MTTPSKAIWPRALKLGLCGALGFWLTNLLISLTPIAAQYRSALGISYFPMLVQALVAGLIIGLGVSFCLLRFHDRLPTTSPVLKAVLLSLVAMVVGTVLFEVLPRVFSTTDTALRYVLIGVAIDALRFLALGLVIGYLYGRSANISAE